jgi:hypothetical protein
MHELGLNFFDANGRMVGMAQVSTKLRDALGDMTQKQRGAALATLFGSDAIRAANIVYSAGPSGIEAYTRATEKQGSAQKMAQAQMKGLPGALERLSGSFETASQVAGDALAPAIVIVAGALEGLANGFTGLPPDVQTVLVALAAVAAIAGPVIWALGSITAAVVTMQTALAGVSAKSFATSFVGKLGPALAAAGIANVAISASEGDWEGAGVKAGGALAGGIAGALLGSVIPGVGTAVGAMVGGGAGSFLAPMLGDLFGTEKKLTPLQQKLRSSAHGLADAFKAERTQVHALDQATNRLNRAHRRQDAATRAARNAQYDLNVARRQSGPNSQDAIRAEIRLARARRGVAQATRAEQRAERQHGVELQITKEQLRYAMLEERHRINVLRRSRDELLGQRAAMRSNGASLQQLQPINERITKTQEALRRAQQRKSQTELDAATKVGPKYARFLRNGTRQALEYGGAIRATKREISTMTAALGELERAINNTNDAYEAGVLGSRANSLRQGIEWGKDRLRGLEQPHGGGKHKGVPQGANGFRNFRGGLALVGERGPELLNLPRGADLLPAPQTRELLTPERPKVRGSRLLSWAERPRRRKRQKQPIIVKLGRRILAEAVVEEQEDDEARL